MRIRIFIVLTAVALLAALENGISQVYAGAGSAGRFPQIAGLKFSADLSKPVGSRVSAVQVGNAKDGFKPLDKNAPYRIITNDFMAGGGDGYAMFKNGKNVNGGDVPIDQSLTDYIKYLNAPISPRVEGRITLTGTPPPAPTAAPTAAVTTTVAPSPVAASPTATPTPTLTPTPTFLPLPMWTPLPIPTFSFQPILPHLLIPCETCRSAPPPEQGSEHGEGK